MTLRLLRRPLTRVTVGHLILVDIRRQAGIVAKIPGRATRSSAVTHTDRVVIENS